MHLSPETASLVDKETRRLVEEAQVRALSLLKEHRSTLDEIAGVLQETEVISGEEIRRIAQGEYGDTSAQAEAQGGPHATPKEDR